MLKYASSALLRMPWEIQLTGRAGKLCYSYSSYSITPMEKDILHQGHWKRAVLSGGRSKIKIKKSVTYLYLLYTNKLSTASCRNCVEICILRPPEDALGKSWQQTRSPQTRGSWQQTSSPQATGLLPVFRPTNV